ncbi:hypothetical protein K474DRAFT_1706956 [Panus rudis PR-1116 ss-1]|nr:hypothetical protein K474DRAFT_1706956 [Panus rudis PR-1116 ss-1]
MAEHAASVHIPTMKELMGAFLLEICVTLIVGFVLGSLYGITIAQTYIYFLSAHEDGKWMKGLISFVTLLETLHTVTTIHMAYTYTIDDFGNIAAIGEIVWSTGVCALSGIILVVFVQGFYIRRIWILSRNNIWLTSIVSFFLFLRVSFGFATSILTYTLGTWPAFRASVGTMFTLTTGLSLSAFVDLQIALILMYYLRSGRTGFKPTDRLIEQLMAYAVNTGLITMLCSVAIVLTFAFLKNSLAFAGLVQMSSKLYANSLLGTLNARGVLRNKMSSNYDSTSTRDRGLSNIRFQNPGTTGSVALQSMQTKPIEIFQNTTKITDTDVDAPGYSASDASTKYDTLA